MISDNLLKQFADLVDAEIQKNFKLFPAVYETQRDNVYDPGVTCAITCLSMLLQSLDQFYNVSVPGAHSGLEDDILKDIRANTKYYLSIANDKLKLGLTTEQGLRTAFHFLAWYSKEKYNIKLSVEGLNREAWYERIRKMTCPFITSTSRGLTKSGHINLFRGWCKDDSGDYILSNDPYGFFPYRTNVSGDGVKYHFNIFPADATYYILTT